MKIWLNNAGTPPSEIEPTMDAVRKHLADYAKVNLIPESKVFCNVLNYDTKRGCLMYMITCAGVVYAWTNAQVLNTLQPSANEQMEEAIKTAKLLTKAVLQFRNTHHNIYTMLNATTKYVVTINFGQDELRGFIEDLARLQSARVQHIGLMKQLLASKQADREQLRQGNRLLDVLTAARLYFDAVNLPVLADLDVEEADMGYCNHWNMVKTHKQVMVTHDFEFLKDAKSRKIVTDWTHGVFNKLKIVSTGTGDNGYESRHPLHPERHGNVAG